MADAFLSFFPAQYGIRYCLLPRDQSGLWHIKGFQAVYPRGARAWPACRDRACDQSYLGSASLVSARKGGKAWFGRAELTSGRRPTAPTKTRQLFSSTARNRTGLGTRRRKPIIGTASTPTSRISISIIRASSRPF